MRAPSGAWTLPALLALGLALAGCASGPSGGDYSAAKHRGRIMYRAEPYQVNGVWYYPRVDYNYDETGTASWYGEQFHGRATADGEIFDMNEPTAAHKTLPLPSVVEVTNLKNGRALRLRVNDRGPFVDGRIIDLSRRAAQLLGYEGAGTAPVRVRILRSESIQVAQAALRGEAGPVMVAQIPQTAPREAAAAPPVEPRPVTRMAAAGPPSLRATEVIAGPVPSEAPVEAAPPMVAAAPLPEIAPAKQSPPAPPLVVAAAAPAPRRSWPSLITEAHAETMRPPAARLAAPEPKPAPPTRHAGRMFVQAGAFAVAENAQRVRARLSNVGSVEVLPASSHGSPLYRVRVGPVANEAEAQRLLDRVVGSGFPGAHVVAE